MTYRPDPAPTEADLVEVRSWIDRELTKIALELEETQKRLRDLEGAPVALGQETQTATPGRMTGNT